MSELKTVLGFEAAGAIATLVQLSTALDGYNAAMRNAAGATRTFNVEGAKISRTLLRLTTAARKHRDATVQVGLAQGKTTQQVQEYANTIKKAANVHNTLTRSVNRSSAGIKQFSTVAAKANTSTSAYYGIVKKAAKTANVLTGRIDKVTAATKQSSITAAKANTSTAAYYNGITKGSKSATQAVVNNANQQEKAAKRVLLSWQSVVRIFAIQVIHQAVTKITTAMWEGVSAARDYEISLAEIQTIGVAFRDDFEGLAEQVRDFSDATGAPLEGVAAGVYQTLSNQVADTSEAFEFMANTQAFATATMTTAADSVDLFSSVINSYNMEINEAAKIGGKLAKIIDLGRIRGEEFANTFGRITVLASQLGITFDEVGASVATLTVTGLKYNEASTLMLNIMLKLIRPTDALKDRYTELGIASSEAGIQAFGFQGFLDKLAEKAGTSATELGKLFNRVRAIRGVMGLANENAKVYADSLAAIKAAGADELFEKRDIIFETNAKQVELELNRLRNVIVDGFGRGVNAALKTTFDIFGGAVGTMRALTVATISAVGVMAILKAEAIAAAFAFGLIHFPAVVLVAGAAIVTAAIVAMFNRAAAAAEEARIKMIKAEETRLKIQLNSLDLANEAQKRHIAKQLSDLQKYLFERERIETQATKNIDKLGELIFGDISSQLSSGVSATNTFFNNLEKQAAEVDSTIKTLNNSIQLVQFGLSDFNFEQTTRGLTPLRKAFVEIERSSDLRRKALAAARKGEFDLANVYNQRAKATATSALNSAREEGNRTLIAKAVKEVQAAFKNEIALLETKKKLTISEKAGIEANTKTIFLQRQELKLLLAEMEELPEAFAAARFDPIKRAEIIAQANDVAKRMQEILGVIKVKFDFKDALTTMRSAITGERGSITSIVRDELNIVEAEVASLTEAKTAIDRGLRIFVPGAGTRAEQQAALVEIQPLLDAHLDATKARVAAEAEITKALTSNKVLVANTLKILQNATATAELAAATGSLFGGMGTTTASKGREAAAAAALLAEKDAIAATTEAKRLLSAQELDVGAFIAVLGVLADLAKAASSPEITSGLGVIIDNLNAVAKKKEEVKQAELSILSPEEFEQSIQRLNAAHNALGPEITAAAATGQAGVATAQAGIRTELQKTETQAIITAKALAAGGGGAVGKRFGSLLYRAGGGFTPRGTDTIAAMLSPGEYVMDASNTRRFYSQLVAMSSGKQPVYRASGGPVTNIGDVSINVTETVSAQQTARETMQAFRRQTRRRASTL